MKLFRRMRERTRSDFGKNPLDFSHTCCFREQVAHIGTGLEVGGGEEVRVAMQSGMTAVFRVFSERYNYVFDDTGQRNWYFLFQRYEAGDD